MGWFDWLFGGGDDKPAKQLAPTGSKGTKAPAPKPTYGPPAPKPTYGPPAPKPSPSASRPAASSWSGGGGGGGGQRTAAGFLSKGAPTITATYTPPAQTNALSPTEQWRKDAAAEIVGLQSTETERLALEGTSMGKTQEELDEELELRRAEQSQLEEVARTGNVNARDPKVVQQEQLARQLAAQREQLLDSGRELTWEEYDSLTPQQQAAVQFNTGLLSAARTDDEKGNDNATKGYLTQLGIDVQSEEEMNEYLQLDRLITENILKRLPSKDDLQQHLMNQRNTNGDLSQLPGSDRFFTAQADANRAATTLAELMGTTGQRALGQKDEDLLPGFGSSARDEVIMRAYLYMVNSDFADSVKTPQDVVNGLAMLNEASGTDVTPQEVWDFLDANLSTVNFRRVGGESSTIPVPEIDPETGAAVKPLDPAEIRRRYGL